MKQNPIPVVAIVDDDPDDQLLIESALTECRPDLRVEHFDDGQILLDHLARCCNEEPQGALPDLILMDLYLPGIDGFELIQEIKSRPGLRHIPLIVLTDTSSDGEIERCYELGANTFVTKPSGFGDLVETMHTLCDYWFGPVRM